MAKTYDATLNRLIDDHLADWAAFLVAKVGLAPGPATALDSDLSATLQADRLFRIDGPDGSGPVGVHLELEATGRLHIPDDLLAYNVAAWAATGLPVRSVLVLLRPKANATDQTETLRVRCPGFPPHLTFTYNVVKVWEESVAVLLAAGPGLAPLALLTNEAAADLDGAFDRFQDRLNQADVPGNVAKGLYGATYVLCGLRYDPARVANLYRNLSMTLEDSSTYQLILARGEARGKALGEVEGALAQTRRILLAQGRRRFGPAPEAAAAALDAVTDCDRLGRMAERILDAAGWDDLLATP